MFLNKKGGGGGGTVGGLNLITCTNYASRILFICKLIVNFLANCQFLCREILPKGFFVQYFEWCLLSLFSLIRLCKC